MVQARRVFHKIWNKIVSDVYMLRKFYQTEKYHIRYGPTVKDFAVGCAVTYFTSYTLFKLTQRFFKNEASNPGTQKANSVVRNIII